MIRTSCLFFIILATASAGCGQREYGAQPASSVLPHQRANRPGTAQTPDPLAPIPHPKTTADKIVNGAKAEARRGVVYDASYKRLSYPGGDVSADRGACTDVLIRALRQVKIDLQQKIHEDITQNLSDYTRSNGLRRADKNIDHRRVVNHLVFLRRYGKRLPTDTTSDAAKTWQPGDLVYWKLPSGLNHCGVLSDVRNADGLPLVIHNLSRTAQEDCLTSWTIIAHYRYP